MARIIRTGIFAEAQIGIADDAHAPLGDVLEAADVVDDREVGDVVEDRVDREVAAAGVLQRRAERVVVRDQEILGLHVLAAADRRSGSRRNVATSTT